MGTTSQRQREAKRDLDHKLALSRPDPALLEELAIACTQPNNTSNNNNNSKYNDATFQYAFALSKSTEPSELRYAVNMLDALVVEGKFEHQIDCMYGAATALYLLGDYEDARSRCEAILRTQPDARFAKELHLAAMEGEEETKREQLKTVAVGSVAAAVAIGVIGIVGALLSKKR